MVPVDQGVNKFDTYAELYALDNVAEEPVDIGIEASLAAFPRKRRKVSLVQQQGEYTPSQSICKAHNPTSEHENYTAAYPDSAKLRVVGDTAAVARVATRESLNASKTQASRKRTKSTREEPMEPAATRGVLHGFRIYFFPANAVHPGRRARIKKAQEHGALWERLWTPHITHVVVDRNMNYDQVIRHLKIEAIEERICVVNEDYLAGCIQYKSVVDPSQHIYRVRGYIPATSHVQEHALTRSPQIKSVERSFETDKSSSERGPEHAFLNAPDKRHAVQDLPRLIPDDELTVAITEARLQQEMLLDEDGSESRPGSAWGDTNATKVPDSPRPTPNWQQAFQCMKSNTGKDRDNPNASTIAVLQEMASHYDQIQDQWRPIAYRKAISTLSKQQEKICTKEDAEKLPSIGSRIAAKIEEIVYTGFLRRLEAAKAEPTDQILQLFLGVYGIGFAQGMRFIAQGCRTLQDLEAKAQLNEAQRIGIARYDDFNARIPRNEVAAHGEVVIQAARAIDAQLTVYIMGSYRRGAKESGDIDTIVTHPTWSVVQLRFALLDTLIPYLFKSGFLQCTLAETSRADGTKWHGASCLPGGKIWRRLDFLIVPASEIGAALIYFTGNDIFNRSMRLLASRKGMRLNQRGLYKDVIRGKNRERVTNGELIEGRDERRIFEVLGVPWREPWERIC